MIKSWLRRAVAMTQPHQPVRAEVACVCGRSVVVDLRTALRPLTEALNILAQLRGLNIGARFDRIDQTLTTERQTMTDFHAELDADLQGLVDQVSAVDADLSRQLADFAAAVGGKLTDAERSQFAAIAQRLTDFTASIDAADPKPPTP